MNILRGSRVNPPRKGNPVRSPPPPIDTMPAPALAAVGSTSAEAERQQASPQSPGLPVASTSQAVSRASSIFSTGTKTSINTLPPQPPRDESHTGPIDIVVGRRNFRITARPGSILSISSFDHPAPPYAEAIGANASHSTVTLTAGAAQDEGTVEEEEGEEGEEETPIEQPTPLSPRVQPPLLESNEDDAASEHRFSAESQSRSASPPSPPMSPLSTSTNAISAHYTAVVRTIDSNHRAELERLREEHAIALAQTRNDIDAAYRVPFREARERAAASASQAESYKWLADERGEEINSLQTKTEAMEKELADLKEFSEKQVQSLQDEIEGLKAVAEQVKLDGESNVLRARNQVEDVWEGRWRDRMRLAAEQVTSSWEDGRDAGWHEGILQGCQNFEAIWARIEARSLPAELQQEIDKWKVEAAKKRQRGKH